MDGNRGFWGLLCGNRPKKSFPLEDGGFEELDEVGGVCAGEVVGEGCSGELRGGRGDGAAGVEGRKSGQVRWWHRDHVGEKLSGRLDCCISKFITHRCVRKDQKRSQRFFAFRPGLGALLSPAPETLIEADFQSQTENADPAKPRAKPALPIRHRTSHWRTL